MDSKKTNLVLPRISRFPTKHSLSVLGEWHSKAALRDFSKKGTLPTVFVFVDLLFREVALLKRVLFLKLSEYFFSPAMRTGNDLACKSAKFSMRRSTSLNILEINK